MNQCAQRPFTCTANISVKLNHWYCMLLYFGGLNTEKTLKTDLYSVFLLIAETIHTLEHVCKCYDIVTVFFHPGQNQVQNGGMYIQHLQHRCHVPMYWFIMACTKPRSRSCVIDKSQNLIQSYNDGIPSCFSFTFVQLKQSQQKIQ